MAGPKKITPYLLFSTESRERAKQQLIDAGDPKPGMGDIAKTVGVMWHALGDDGKEVRRDFPANAPRQKRRERAEDPRLEISSRFKNRRVSAFSNVPRPDDDTHERPRTHPHRTSRHPSSSGV